VCKNEVNKVLTYHSGWFAFSHKFDKMSIIEPLMEAKVLCKVIDELPILPHLSTKIEDDLVRRSIFGTAAIEGNPLAEDQVDKILKDTAKESKDDIYDQAEKEIRNLKEAYNYLRNIKGPIDNYRLTEETIKYIHSIITKDIKHEYNIPGAYRNNKVVVGNEDHGGVYTPPKVLDDISDLMGKFIEWINCDELIRKEPIIRAGLAHYHLALIHPFSEGNGRTARLVEAMLLRSVGIKYVPIMLSNHYYRYIDDYFIAFTKAEKNSDYDVTPFLEFYIKGLRDSGNSIKEKITYYIRKFSLRDYFRFLYIEAGNGITQRQHDLLMLLLDWDQEFVFSDLFNNDIFKILYRRVSESTAKRDLKKLLSNNLLVYEDKKYKLNLRVLG
jgi:Fic family protein